MGSTHLPITWSTERQITRRGVLWLGLKCDVRCKFCYDELVASREKAWMSADEAFRALDKFRYFYLTFNPYFEWTAQPEIEFQSKHSEIAPYLARAIDRCTELGIEANVRYIPPCQLPGREAHVYTGYQLPYDPHEWDYNSWYDTGQEGQPSPAWYLDASRRQQQRHSYLHVSACSGCALRNVCDGFHAQYVARWGGDEAKPYDGPLIDDPSHFVRHQDKLAYRMLDGAARSEVVVPTETRPLDATHLPMGDDGRAGVKRTRVAMS